MKVVINKSKNRFWLSPLAFKMICEDKNIDALKSMFGILYSRNFYCIFDTNSPKKLPFLISG